MPAALAADAPMPGVSMLTTPPEGAKAKLLGAVTVLLFAVQLEVSTSATNASFTPWFTYSGNSSDANLKSKVRQFAAAGTFRFTRRMLTSKSVFPRTLSPWSSRPSSPKLLGSSASATLPVVRIPNVEPFVGNDPKGALAVPLGAPAGGRAANEEDTSVGALATMAWAMGGAVD